MRTALVLILLVLAVAGAKARFVDTTLMEYPAGLLVCTPDDNCQPQAVWQGPYFFEFAIGNCQFRAHYYRSHTCNTFCDIQIREITPLSPNCGTFNLSLLMGVAMREAVEQEVENGSPCAPIRPPSSPGNPGVSCNDYFRVTAASCWRYYPVLELSEEFREFRPYGNYHYCAEDKCCRTTYRVCWVDDELVVTQTSVYIYGTGNCPVTPWNQTPYECQPVCPN